ncbi:MAG: lysophospholipase [Desulfitibacter sp. BRH_c19]|nr:MAG: lysophospholipase [Desulfitibacter sp. BRH_c19]
MNHYEFYWDSFDNLRMFAQVWEPVENKKVTGVVTLVHGLGEHSGRYANVAASLVGRGFAVVAFDQRGHGKSQGKRGHTPSYEALIKDVEDVLQIALKKFPGILYFLYGHSLGGNIVINYALRLKPNIHGVIVTSPWLKIISEPSSNLLYFVRLLNKVCCPLTQANGLKAQLLSHDQNVVDDYINDPLVHNRISMRLFITAHEAGNWALENANELTTPMLLMHGEDDQITSPDASKEFAEKAGDYCTFKIWEGLYHELHNELIKDKILKFMGDWLKTRL